MKEIDKTPFYLSVWMIAFNQRRYIAKAIESVLVQKTDFPVKLIIGDDCSTDGTTEIIDSYVAQYPDKIKLIKRSENIGMMRNMVSTLGECKGKYVAMLEADDYWMDEYKLKKQVDLLEKDQSLFMVFHNAKVIYENNKDSHLFTLLENRIYSAEEIIRDWKVQTATVVFRNFPIDFPEFTEACVHGDILLFLLILQNGNAQALQDVMSVYRKNEGGTTIANSFKVDFVIKVLNQLNNMDQYFNYKYHDSFRIPIKYWNKALITSYKKEKRYFKYFIELIRFLIHYPADLFNN